MENKGNDPIRQAIVDGVDRAFPFPSEILGAITDGIIEATPPKDEILTAVYRAVYDAVRDSREGKPWRD